MNIHYLFYALVLFAILRLSSRIIQSLAGKNFIHKVLLRIFPLVEFAIWLGFSLWALSRAFSSYPYYHLLILLGIGCLVLIASWYFLRDFVAGIILKTEIPFAKNQKIKVLQTEGILKKLGYRTLEIESNNGEVVKIPYSQLAISSINIQSSNDGMQGYEVIIKVHSSIPIQEVKDKVSSAVLLTPWASMVQAPNVQLLKQHERESEYSVHFHSLSERHAAHISHFLQNFLEEAELKPTDQPK